MAYRKTPFVEGEFYHIYNRGVDKRNIFSDSYDFERFVQSIIQFNTIEPIGSIFENTLAMKREKNQFGHPMSKLVNFVAYCINPNHYHFLLEQVADKGIEKFMQRLGNGYTKFFNNKYQRSGVLFQGAFKARHIGSNEYLLHVSSYINLNNKVHKLKFGHRMSKDFENSSWNEYLGKSKSELCKKEIILGQFKSINDYKEFASSSLEGTLLRREDDELKELLIEGI